MNEPRQLQFATIGATGCQLLSMLHIAEDVTGGYIDAYQAYLTAVRAGTLRADCYVLDHEKLMDALTGHIWQSSLEQPNYVLRAGEYAVQYWTWQDGETLHTHFVTPDYDPYGASLTVKNGQMVSIRVYRRIA